MIVTLLGADEKIALLCVLPDRKKETVVVFLCSIPLELRASIELICTDMYECYTNAIKEEVAQARVVIDRFYVAKAYRECADKLRKSALRELKQGLEKEEYKLLKGTMWPFRHNAAVEPIAIMDSTVATRRGKFFTSNAGVETPA